MIKLKEEIKKFKPILEVGNIEKDLSTSETKDLYKLLKELSKKV